MSKEFDIDDVDILIQAVSFFPEVKLCALALQRARRVEIRYPVKTSRGLVKLLEGNKSETAYGHTFTPAHINHYVSKELFPINNDSDLIKAVYMGIMRCREDMEWAAKAPANSKELLDDIQKRERR